MWPFVVPLSASAMFSVSFGVSEVRIVSPAWSSSAGGDVRVGPQCVEQLLFRDQRTRVVEQMEQEVEELRRQVDNRAVPDDAITRAIDKEGAESIAGACHVSAIVRWYNPRRSRDSPMVAIRHRRVRHRRRGCIDRAGDGPSADLQVRLRQVVARRLQ